VPQVSAEWLTALAAQAFAVSFHLGKNILEPIADPQV
jgi:hypothetical protein